MSEQELWAFSEQRSDSRCRSFDRSQCWPVSKNTHLIVHPLDLFDDVNTSMHNERIQLPRFGGETRYAVTALLRGPKLNLEEGVVFGAHNAEIVGHCRSMGHQGEKVVC